MPRLQRGIDVANDATRGEEEIRRLQSFINDLISIQALPAIWNGRESGHIIGTLLDVLVSVLRLDFAYARLSDSTSASRARRASSMMRGRMPRRRSMSSVCK